MGKNNREALRKSAALNWEGMQYIRTILVEGISEKEVAEGFTQYVLAKGATRLAFAPIVGFREHTAIPHHRPTDWTLCVGDAVTIDVGVIVDDHASDLTRSFFFHKVEVGRFGEAVHRAHQLALAMCQPGRDFLEIDMAVREFFQSDDLLPFVKHKIGHGIGLQVHESPSVGGEDRILQEGDAITIEPGLYEEGVGGYRHEDTILITKDGYENFYQNGIWTG